MWQGPGRSEGDAVEALMRWVAIGALAVAVILALIRRVAEAPTSSVQCSPATDGEAMDDERDPNQELTEPETASTSPPGGKTHEATTPPGNPEPEEGATERAKDKLDQAAGGP